MKQFPRVVLAATVLAILSSPAPADDKQVKAVLDKAIKAHGGEAKLAKIKALTWKGKGKISIADNDTPFTNQVTIDGLDRIRAEFEGEFGGNKVKGVTVVNGTKGWRKFNDNVRAMDRNALANEKRSMYLQVIPVTLVPLRGKGFKVESADDEKVDGKAAHVLKVTGPDKKDFKLYFDKKSSLLVKMVAKVPDFMGNEVTQETTFGGYKELGGIKKATTIVAKRDGEKFLSQTVTEFKTLTKVDAKTFAEPE